MFLALHFSCCIVWCGGQEQNRIFHSYTKRQPNQTNQTSWQKPVRVLIFTWMETRTWDRTPTPPALPTFSLSLLSTSDECSACGLLRVPHGWEQEPSPVCAVRIVASPCGLIHQDLTRVSRVRPWPEHPRARADRLRRCRRWALEVAVVERVRHGPRQDRGEVDDHSVYADVSVWGHQRRRLRAVNGLMKRPGTMPGALSLRVTHPRVRNSVLPRRIPVSTAPAPAEPVHGNILIRQHNVNRPGPMPALNRQKLNLVILERLSERTLLVEYLFSDDEGGGAAALILPGGLPPRPNRRRRNVNRVKRLKKIEEYRPLGRRELPVPDEINGDLTLQKGAVVVLEHKRLLLNQSREGWLGNAGEKEEEQSDGGGRGTVVNGSHDW